MDAEFKIHTDRLILRSYDEKDLKEHVAILSNWDVTKWLSTNIPFPYGYDEGEIFIREAKANFIEGNKISFSIINRETGQHMGGIKLFSANEEKCEVGYWLAPGFWSKGYATEFLAAVIGWLRDKGKVKELVAQTAKKNSGSRKVLEKVGFVHKGTPPPEYSRCGHGDGCSEYYVLKLKTGGE